MSGYRQMRRHARRVRRAGMQPMMVINTGDNAFPELAIVVIGRALWRYRSELAPLAVAALPRSWPASDGGHTPHSRRGGRSSWPAPWPPRGWSSCSVG